MSLRELGDEFYRMAIKSRDDVIYELHKEICKKYEEALQTQSKTINELQADCEAMKEKINNDNTRINSIVEDSDVQITELENKIEKSTKDMTKLNKKIEILLRKEQEAKTNIEILEEERDEFRITVEALKGTIDELKNANLNITNNLRRSNDLKKRDMLYLLKYIPPVHHSYFRNLVGVRDQICQLDVSPYSDDNSSEETVDDPEAI
ncbi:hypothetical protein WDU94_012283 [Cyamophila willieti]